MRHTYTQQVSCQHSDTIWLATLSITQLDNRYPLSSCKSTFSNHPSTATHLQFSQGRPGIRQITLGQAKHANITYVSTS
jgi:hypothetical protein